MKIIYLKRGVVPEAAFEPDNKPILTRLCGGQVFRKVWMLQADLKLAIEDEIKNLKMEV